MFSKFVEVSIYFYLLSQKKWFERELLSFSDCTKGGESFPLADAKKEAFEF